MDDRLARFWIGGADPGGVKEGFAVVDALHRVESDEDVLVEVDGIGAERFHIAPIDQDMPRAGTEKGFAGHQIEDPL